MMPLFRAACVVTLVIFLVQVCGQAPLNTLIVGGEDAPDGAWPWQASLHSSQGHFCGGSLINKEWVLSAAHCVAGLSASAVTIFLGQKSQEGSNPNAVSRAVIQIISNPDYNHVTFNNDIALLKLSSPVTFTKFIQPICLAADGSTFRNGTDSWVTGWGTINSGVPLPSPQNLQEVEVPVVGNRQCFCLYATQHIVITDNMICAGLLAGGKDSCQGDSGGPMVSKQGSRWIQAGIVSFGIGCAKAGLPGVYSRVSQYQSWINSQIRIDQPGFVTFNSSGTNSDINSTCDGLPPAPTLLPITTIPPPPVVCGSAPLNSRVGGGSSLASAGLWPWMASLQRNRNHVCGGALVSEEFVMSSADCFSSSTNTSEWTVILGRLKQNGSNPNEVSVNVANITLSNLTGNNVAVLQLASKLTLSDYIQPVCVDLGDNTFSTGTQCWAAGWGSGKGGAEQVLQEFQTSVVDCGNSSSADNICTGVVELQQGDVGGPLMCKQGMSWFQAAVLTVDSSSEGTNSSSNSSSRSDWTPRASDIQVFTKTSHFSSFLKSTVGSFPSPASNTTTNTTTSSTTTTNTTTSSTTANNPTTHNGARPSISLSLPSILLLSLPPFLLTLLQDRVF